MEIAALGLRVDADGVDGAAKSLENLTAQGAKAEKSLEGMEKTAAKTQKTLEKLGQSGAGAEQAVKKVGDGVAAIGDGGQSAAQKVDSASKSIVGNINKTAAAAESAEKSASKFYEVLGRPVSPGGGVMAYAEQLKSAEAAQEAASQGLGKIGMSAKATEAALRGVPAQFTDIFVSLQGGQAPMTVFLQQGGQLKDMFGGAAPAAKALGGYVLGLVNPFTVAAAAAAALGAAYYQGSQEADEFVRAIVLTGNASGVTTSQLRDYAREIDAVVGTQAQAASGLADFVAAGVRGGDELRRYTQTAIEWEKVTSQAVGKTAEQFSALQKDPLAAVLKLNEGANFLTVSVYEQIKALEDQGKKADASRVAMDALDSSMRDRGKTIKESLGYIERGWISIKGAAADAWDAMLNVGRASSINQQLGAVQKELSALLAQSESGFGQTDGGAATGRSNAAYVKKIKERIDALRAEEWALLEKADAEKIAAVASEEAARRMNARIAFDKDYAEALKKEISLEEKLTKARNEAIEAGKSDADIKTVLAWVTEEHNKANKGSAAAAREAKKELSDQAKVYAELAGLSSTYYDELARGQKQFEKGEITREQYIKFVEQLIEKQPFVIAQKKEEAKVLQESLALAERERQQRLQVYAAAEKNASSIQDGNKKLREEIELIGLSSEAQESILMQRERAILLVKQQHLAELERAEAVFGFMSREQIALMQEIEAMEERLALMGDKGIREKSARVGKQIEQDWEKVSQTISRTLSDYIMAGGTDAAVYLKRLFANLVLEPLVQIGVNSLLGMGAPAAGMASGGVNPLSVLSGGKTAMGIFGGGAGAGFMNGLGAWGSGGSVTGVLSNPGLYTGAELLGTVAPFLLGGLALMKILSGDWFGSRGPNHSGGVASTATQDRAEAARQALGVDAWGNTLGDFTSRGNAEIDKQLDTTLKGMLDLYKQLAKIGGATVKDIDIAAGFSVNPKHGDEGAMGFFQIIDKATGEILARFKDREMDTDPQKAWAKFVAEMGGALVTEIKKGDIPGWMKEELDALGDDVTLEGLNAAIQRIAVIDAAFKGWADTVIGFANLTAKAQTELLKFSNGIEALANNVNAFYAGFYSEQERAEILQRQVRDQLKKLGIDIDPAGGEAAKKAFRKLIEDALASGNNELAAKLLALAQLFGVAADAAQKSAEVAADAAKTAADEAARALEEAQQKAKDLAMANFEAAIAREQQYWQAVASNAQEAVQAITGILTPLKQAAKELFGSIESAGQMQAVQGMLYIERAIAGLRGGAKLSSFDGLTDAISAARGGITSGRYASQFERERDALVLANQLKQIAGYGDTQLSVEERQLKNSQEQLQKLDKTLGYWRDLLDGNKAQIDATLSVEQAIKALEALLFPENPPTSGGGSGPGKSPTPDWGGGGGGGFQPANSGKYKTPTAILGGGAVIYDYAAPDYEKRLDSLAPTFEKYRGTGDFTGLADDFRAAGGTAKDLAYLYGFSEADVLAALDRNGIPRFDVGTNRVPQDMLAMVHKNEAIVPAAFNPWAGGSMSGGNLEGLVQQLLSEAVQSREERRQQAGEIVRLNAQIARLLQRWDGDGMPQPRKEGEGVAA
ncbi:phage tail length tape measure family protein [Delftia tsuruhatensis]|uniref:phage tail length tape measure family protein n=1 Tax=Delftia tsuruhatensis TaxID=180282 RepID=UPI00244438A9|nr:phage tail length tape measure family protein [Delftia tsuruhatensis]MDH0777546.1 phage tail length tape measure family protein [Delftia tsuruhatensis]MDH1461882.1 phage tail length tape measure family protein [Delftia tsuruhatensis]WGG09939.1 phage tail length tape measure family protein [Delftia tsuruhatensis]